MTKTPAQISASLGLLVYRTSDALTDESDQAALFEAVATHNIAKLEEMARYGNTIEDDLLEEEIEEIKS